MGGDTAATQPTASAAPGVARRPLRRHPPIEAAASNCFPRGAGGMNAPVRPGARGGRGREVLPDVTVVEGSVETKMGQLLAIQPASPSSMLARIAAIGRDCRGILDPPLQCPLIRTSASTLRAVWEFRSPRRGTMSETDSQRLYSSVRLAPRPHKLRLPSHRQLSSTSYLPITVQRCACACMVRDSPVVLWTIQRFILHPSASLRNLLARSSPVNFTSSPPP